MSRIALGKPVRKGPDSERMGGKLLRGSVSSFIDNKDPCNLYTWTTSRWSGRKQSTTHLEKIDETS